MPAPRRSRSAFPRGSAEALATLRQEFPWGSSSTYASPGDDDGGGFTLNHAQALQAVTSAGLQLIVDLGCGGGRATEWWCRTTQATVLAVDHWLGNSEDRLDPQRRTALAGLPVAFQRRLLPEFRDRVIPLRISSLEALRRLFELKLVPDLVYCDGSRQEDAVADDVRFVATAWPNAVLCGGSWPEPSVRVGVVQGLRDVLGGDLPQLVVSDCVWRFVR